LVHGGGAVAVEITDCFEAHDLKTKVWCRTERWKERKERAESAERKDGEGRYGGKEGRKEGRKG
jgi:hypothetical protein